VYRPQWRVVFYKGSGMNIRLRNPIATRVNRFISQVPTNLSVILFVLFTLSALLLLKTVNIVSPIMGGDEYAYFSQAREFPNIANLLTYDARAAQTYNIFYFWFGHQIWNIATDPALTIRILQALLYIMIFPIFYCLSCEFLSRQRSLLVVVVSLVTALSSYSAYLMPETVYFFIFFVLVTFAVHFSNRPRVSAFGSGVLAAMLTLTKPHGIAIALGIGLAWIVFALFPRLIGIARMRSMLALAVFAIAFYIGLVSVNGLLTDHVQFNPLLFVGDFYANFWTTKPRSIAPPRDLLTVVAGNAVPLALLIGFPIIYALVSLVQRIPNENGARSSDHRLWFFTILTLCISFVILGMAINFTAQIGGDEIWRMHGRYYSFIIPCFILLMFAAAENRGAAENTPPPWCIRAAAVVGVALMAIVQFYWRAGYTIVPWDFPEIFCLTSWGWVAGVREVGTAIVFVGVVCFVAIFIWPTRAPVLFVCFFMAVNMASHVQTVRWQFFHARQHSPETNTAAALRLLIPPESLDRGVIFSADRELVPFILIPMRSRSRVVMLPPDSVIDRANVGDAVWVITEGKFRVQLDGAKVMLRKTNLAFIALQDLEPFIK
jgi:hypothetical protein